VVVRCEEGLTRGGEGGTVAVFIREAISLTSRPVLSRFSSLLVKLDKTEELCMVPSGLS
ncbi:hypothetical protein Tco_0036505, partial [Tanacetum coccineum]